MSYVEKTVYRYLKKVLTSGLKALFTKKFLIYTIFFLIIIITTTITALVGIPEINLTIFGIPPEDMLHYILYFEIAFSIAYLLIGLFLAKSPLLLHSLLLVLLAGGITTGFYFLDDYRILTITCFVLYCLWMIFTVWSAFNFSKNIFGSKITGSILFMGKREGGNALFSGIIIPLIIIVMGLDGYILYEGIVKLSILYIFTGAIGIVIGGFIIITCLYLARKDDIFYTILPFFYLLTNSHTIQLVYRLIREDVNYISWLNILVSIFFLLNSISKYYRKINKLDIDFLPKDTTEPLEDKQQKTKQALKEEWYLSDFLKFVSDRGVIMMILGCALAYHGMMLQIGFNKEAITEIITLQSGAVQTAHSITMFFAALVVVLTIIVYYTNKRLQAFLSPQIFRLNFLPPYEELEKFIVDVREGNIDWKILARDVTVKLAKKGISSTARLSVAAKDQSIELAKKGVELVKTKAESALDKTKEWGKRMLQGEEEDKEEFDDDF